MIKFYSTWSLSSRKTKKWLNFYNLNFEEIKIADKSLSHDQLIEILALTDNGFPDIISKRCAIYKQKNLDQNNYKFQEILDLLQDTPNLLKTPIILDNKKLQIGFNEEELRQFLPKEFRMEKNRKMVQIKNDYI
ncbi:Spx/MgsR family RNA polymerase-binding regulatory protein [Lactococcus lactis]|uniref:Spx/MgsR family RNA polymerase-binding regulatory protein n=1 Tax=Lactococcus lactis TaxID=1358 RepID=UPI0032E3C11C